MRATGVFNSTWMVYAARGVPRVVAALGMASGLALGCGTGDDVTAAVPAADAGVSADATTADGAASSSDATASADRSAADATSAADAAAPGDAALSLSDAPAKDAAAPTDAFVPPIYAAVRLANWSVDSPSVDVCIAPMDTSNFTGPLIASADADAGSDSGMSGDAGPSGPGLAFSQITAYFNISPGTYTARLVVAGSTDCSSGLGSDLSMPALVAGSLETVALVGEAHPSGSGPALKFAAFSDVWPMNALVTPLPEGGGLPMALRVINASSIPLLDVGSGDFADKTFSLLFSGIAFGQAGVPTGKQIQGAGSTYAVTAPILDTPVSVHTYGSATDTLVVHGVSIAPGAVVTLAVLPVLAVSADAGAPIQLLECVDNSGTLGAMGNCWLP